MFQNRRCTKLENVLSPLCVLCPCIKDCCYMLTRQGDKCCPDWIVQTKQDNRQSSKMLCLWFRASLICISNCLTRCNTKQSIYYSASSLYMFWVSTTPIIRSTQNCNYSLWYWSYFFFFLQLPPSNVTTWPRWREVAAQKIWPVPEAVVTVLCTTDDGCVWHPKHVEWIYLSN